MTFPDFDLDATDLGGSLMWEDSDFHGDLAWTQISADIGHPLEDFEWEVTLP